MLLSFVFSSDDHAQESASKCNKLKTFYMRGSKRSKEEAVDGWTNNGGQNRVGVQPNIFHE